MANTQRPLSENHTTQTPTFLTSARRWHSHFRPPSLSPTPNTSQSNSNNAPQAKSSKTKPSATALAQDYYNIVSRNYEIGWGTHFHYAAYAPGDTIQQALRLYMHRLALLTGLRPGMRVLDVGCGIGGPARELARLVGCEIIGVSINQYHVDRATELTLEAGLGRYCTFVVGDFHALDFPDGYFDAAYATEATCYARDLSVVYGEIKRAVKKGGTFGTMEWAMTDLFDEGNGKHRLVRSQIEMGNGIAEMRTVKTIREAFKATGWQIETDEDHMRRFEDLSEPVLLTYEDTARGKRKVQSYSSIRVPRRDFHAATNPDAWFYAPAPDPAAYRPLPLDPKPPVFRPWYYPLAGDKAAKKLGINKEDVQRMDMMSPWRRWRVEWTCSVLVKLGLVAPESLDVIRTMCLCVDSVREGGRLGIFTPSYLFVCRNPGREDEEIAVKHADEGLEKGREGLSEAHVLV